MARHIGYVLLFLFAAAFGGLGGAVGSIIGNAGGRIGLFAGGLGGGVVFSVLAAGVAAWRRWIPRERFWTAAAGAALGFLVAASIAINTLSSPIGPMISTLFIGLGAVAGAAYRRPGTAA